MEIKNSIDDLEIQDPPVEDFSASDLTWTKYGATEHHVDDVALLPYDRVEAFIMGECMNAECPTQFHIERQRKREKGSLKEFKNDDYLSYKHYWCSFGPENYGEGGDMLQSRKYRINTRNRAARPQSMRGCTCNFTVRRLYARPSVALIVYHERRHVNKSGVICHGPLDRDAIGPGARKIPYMCSEIQQRTMSLMYLGLPEENVLQTHIEGIQRYCGSNAQVDTLASQYVQKLGIIIKRSTHELDLDDQASIRLWVEKNKKSVFFYQDSSDTDPFILGIQTEWQLQMLIRFGRHGLLACDSSFGISKLKYPLYTLLTFDSRLHAIPIAWVITRTNTKEDVQKWMKALVDKVVFADPAFSISGFIIDDPALEIDPIRELFCCPVLFCLWRIRRSWLRNVVKKCNNIAVQREVFKQLGVVLHSIWSDTNPMDGLEIVMQDFVDQSAFIQYMKGCWVPKLDMWLTTMKSLPLASQETCGAIEAYHIKLKLRIYDDSQLDLLQRVDWLVHKLTTELHSSYWLDLYADESGSFPAVKEEYVQSTSWHRALQIPDNSVTFDDAEHLSAIVVSQNDPEITHLVSNPGSEFSFCDCCWSMQGNMCKHIIKVNMMCQNQNSCMPSLSYQSFEKILQNISRMPIDDSLTLDISMAWAAQVEDKVQKLVELMTADNNIANVVNELPMKWCNRKERNFMGRPAEGPLALPAFPKRNGKQKSGVKKKTKKRKRLSKF